MMFAGEEKVVNAVYSVEKGRARRVFWWEYLHDVMYVVCQRSDDSCENKESKEYIYTIKWAGRLY